ncbi:hypothetical protein EDC96DRAFT_570324 [Choanephora cucurbitarum]|nr:hypothetical protein EDC96DRAFT_570324 [Choanephora cucurbitarum]
MHRQIPTVATSSSRPAARCAARSATRFSSNFSSRPVAPAPVDPISLPATPRPLSIAPLPLTVAPLHVAPFDFQRDEIIERMGERIDRLEALEHGRNPAFVRAVDEAFSVSRDSFGLGFSPDFSFSTGFLNWHLKGLETWLAWGSQQHLSVAVMRSIDARISNRFDNARRRVRRVVLSEHARLEMAPEQAKRRRLQRNCTARRDCFNASSKVLSAGFGSVEECAGLLNMAYMSDEEVEGEGFGRSFRVLVPSWRSDMLTEFHQFLDRIRLQNSTSFRGPRYRKVVEQALSDELRQRLPR